MDRLQRSLPGCRHRPECFLLNILHVTGGAPGNSGLMTNSASGAALPVTTRVTSAVAGVTGGTIHIYQSSYHGALSLPFVSTGTNGYAIVADRLEEFTVGADTCVGITKQSSA